MAAHKARRENLIRLNRARQRQDEGGGINCEVLYFAGLVEGLGCIWLAFVGLIPGLYAQGSFLLVLLSQLYRAKGQTKVGCMRGMYYPLYFILTFSAWGPVQHHF